MVSFFITFDNRSLERRVTNMHQWFDNSSCFVFNVCVCVLVCVRVCAVLCVNRKASAHERFKEPGEKMNLPRRLEAKPSATLARRRHSRATSDTAVPVLHGTVLWSAFKNISSD